VLTNQLPSNTTEAPALRRGERRKQHTRRRLLDAAAQTYAISGVEGATISAITERADVGLGTFYLHFEDKDAIAVAVCGVVVTRILDEETLGLDEVRSVGGDPDPLAVFTRALCNRAAADSGLLKALLRWEGTRSGLSADANELRRLLIPRLAERARAGMESGRYRIEDADMVAQSVMGVYSLTVPSASSDAAADWSALSAFLERSVVAMVRV
jgi:AcrR family transcriptional regulator